MIGRTEFSPAYGQASCEAPLTSRPTAPRRLRSSNPGGWDFRRSGDPNRAGLAAVAVGRPVKAAWRTAPSTAAHRMDSGRTELTDSLIASDLTELWELGYDHHSLTGHHTRHPARHQDGHAR